MLKKFIIVLFLFVLVFTSCTFSKETYIDPNYKPPTWALGKWGDSIAKYVAYDISETEFTFYWPNGASFSYVSGYAGKGLKSEIDSTNTKWTLIFGEDEIEQTIIIEKGDNCIIVDGSGKWQKM